MVAMIFLYALDLGVVRGARARDPAAGAVVTGVAGSDHRRLGCESGDPHHRRRVPHQRSHDKAQRRRHRPARGDGYEALNSTPLGVPVGVYAMIALALVLQYVLRRTVFGRQVILIGENRDAARAAGIRIARVTAAA